MYENDPKAKRVLQVLRKYDAAMDQTDRLDYIMTAFDNYCRAHEAAEQAGYGDLARAYSAHCLLNSPTALREAKRLLDSPEKTIASWFDSVAGFEDFLTT